MSVEESLALINGPFWQDGKALEQKPAERYRRWPAAIASRLSREHDEKEGDGAERGENAKYCESTSTDHDLARNIGPHVNRFFVVLVGHSECS
jgi:hypothetical protein